MPVRNGDLATELFVDTPRGGVRLTVRTHEAARQLPRRDRRGQEAVRLGADALAMMLRDEE